MDKPQGTIGTDLTYAAQILRQGGLVALPTETVYGLAGDALNARAVAEIFATKQRPTFDPLIVHIADLDWLPRLAQEIPPQATRLMQAFWPGPLTFVLQKTDLVPDLVTSGLATVAIRMPNHPLALELIRAAGTPLAAPSANLFGRTSPTQTAHVFAQLGDRIDYILEGGPCQVGIESTIVYCSADQVQILRPGGITREQLEQHLEPGVLVTSSSWNESEQENLTETTYQPLAPGQLKEHYAPNTPLFIENSQLSLPSSERIGLLTYQLSRFPEAAAFQEEQVVIEDLSPTGDLAEAACGFFAALHRLDAADLKYILATPFPDHGLGRALNDRLRRAAHSERLPAQ